MVKMGINQFIKLKKSQQESQNKAQKLTVELMAPAKQIKVVSHERMKRFFNMTPEDLPIPQRKKYACERDLNLLNKLKDTIKCSRCGHLYERAQIKKHLEHCEKNIMRQYGCALCMFKHKDKLEMETHISTMHKL